MALGDIPIFEENNCITQANLLESTHRPHISRPDCVPHDVPWMLSGGAYLSANSNLRSMDDGVGIEQCDEAPVMDGLPSELSPKKKRGKGRGKGRKKNSHMRNKSCLNSKAGKKSAPINSPKLKRRPVDYKSKWEKLLACERSRRFRAKIAESTAIDEKNSLLSLLKYEGIKVLRTDEDRYPDVLLDLIISCGTCPSAGGARAPIAGVCTTESLVYYF